MIAVLLDGFHLARKELPPVEDPELAHARWGAPFIFNTLKIIGLLEELRQSSFLPTDERKVILAPSFDHLTKDPWKMTFVIPPSALIVLIDGKYLLLGEGDWRHVVDFLDVKILVTVDPVVARSRVASRQVLAGIETTLETAI